VVVDSYLAYDAVKFHTNQWLNNYASLEASISEADRIDALRLAFKFKNANAFEKLSRSVLMRCKTRTIESAIQTDDGKLVKVFGMFELSNWEDKKKQKLSIDTPQVLS
jgi:hypothetical protein